MAGPKNELEELRLAVARLEAEVQVLRGEVARAPARTIGGGDDEGGGYDPWVKCYGGSEDFVYAFKIKRFDDDICVCLTSYDLVVDGVNVDLTSAGSGSHQDGEWLYYVVGSDTSDRYVFLNVTKTANGCSAEIGFQRSPAATWSLWIGSCPARGAAGRPKNNLIGTLVLNTGGGSVMTETEDVVTNVEYNTSDRALRQTKKQITILAKQTGATTTVFTASPHSAEHATGGGS